MSFLLEIIPDSSGRERLFKNQDISVPYLILCLYFSQARVMMLSLFIFYYQHIVPLDWKVRLLSIFLKFEKRWKKCHCNVCFY